MDNAASLEQKYQSSQAEIAQLKRLLEQNSRRLVDQEKSLAEKEQLLEKKDWQIRLHLDEIAYLKERLSILLSKRYRLQSEQLKAIQGQLFDEAELEKAITETQQSIAALEDATKAPPSETSPQADQAPRTPPKRQKLPSHLRRVEIVVDVDEADKQAMGDDWVLVGYESAEQLAVQQREYFVKCFKRAKYVRKTPPTQVSHESGSETHPGILVAPQAKTILPKSIADASLLADVLCSKFIDAMSFYRTEKRLQREGIHIGYSTLCDWPIQLYERLGALERLFYEALGQCRLWHLDETTLQVLDEPGRNNALTSYLWGIRTGPPDPPMVLFHYDARRNYEALEQWLRPCLGDFRGAIVTDEHSPYNTLVKNRPAIRAHGGCLAHCRRKFADAAKGRRDGGDAHKVLQKIALIYAQEKKLAHLQGPALRQARQEHIAPLMQRLKALLESLVPKYLNKGAMKTAIGYALNNWSKFAAFLEHPELPLDNNAMEQAIRPFTLGRKNWIFAGSPRGAHASAFIYSLIESAKANGLEPWHYLNALFERYPHAANDDQRRQLLPWNFEK